MCAPCHCGTPALALAMTIASGRRAVMPSTETRRSEAPTPQLAPNASGAASKPVEQLGVGLGREAHHGAAGGVEARGRGVGHAERARGARPRRGFPRAPTWSRSRRRRRRLAFRPSICSAKTSAASSSVSGPSGASRSPVGPTEPATTTRRPALSATSRAISAASRFSSRTRPSSLCSISRRRLPPNELVRMMSAPASTKVWCRARIFSGLRVVPQFRRLARGQPHVEQVGAGRAVGEQRAAFGEKGCSMQGLEMGRRSNRAAGATARRGTRRASWFDAARSFMAPILSQSRSSRDADPPLTSPAPCRMVSASTGEAARVGEETFLGLDIGTSSVKALLVDADQRTVAEASAALDVSRPQPLWSEQNPARLGRRRRGRGPCRAPPRAGGVRAARRRRPFRPDARRDFPRRRRQAAASGDPVERRPLVRRMRGTRAPRARIFSPAPATWPCPASPRRRRCGSPSTSRRRSRATKRVLLPKDYVRLKLTGEAVSRNVGRRRHAVARHRAPALGRDADRRQRPDALAHAGAGRGLRCLRLSVAADGDGVGPWRAAKSRSPAAAATMRPRRSASARSRRARASSRSAPRASSSPSPTNM